MDSLAKGGEVSGGGERLLEVTLISAQGLKPPAGLRRRLQAYAVAWVDADHKLRTRPDRAGGADPVWHDRLLFRVCTSALADDSPAAVSVEIYASAAGAWHLGGDSLVGSVRFLLGDHHLLSLPVGFASIFAFGVRRSSGRFHGLLNVAASLLAAPPSPAAAAALRLSPAVSLRDLSAAPLRGRALRVLNRGPPPPSPPPSFSPKKPQVAMELNTTEVDGAGGEEEGEETREMGGLMLCGPCLLPFPRKIHISPSDENLQAYAGILTGSSGLAAQSPRR